MAKEKLQLPVDENQHALQVCPVLACVDVSGSKTVRTTGKVIRVYAVGATTIKESGSGAAALKIPEGGVEYFAVTPGMQLAVTGNCNIGGVTL